MNPCVFIIFSLLLLRLEITTANRVVNKCFDKERHALLHFKAGLQDPLGSLSTWTAEEDDCCEWFGVNCNDQTGHITDLYLSLFGLVGEISHSLLNLTYLNQLDLSYNSFQGTIPTFIGSMTRLTSLHLGNNGFNGTIPKSVGSLTKLMYLNLGGNNITGPIPRFIGFLAKLIYLNLGGNNLTGPIPRFIGFLAKLEILDIRSNNLSGTIPPEFGNLTNLQQLYLRSIGSCRVENLEWLSHLLHLQVLLIDGVSLAKANHWVNVISSLPKLLDLSLDGCELSEVIYPYSSFLNSSSSSSIETLYIRNNNLTSSMYRWLFPLTSNKLRQLYLSGNVLDGIPKYLGNICHLKRLEFNNNSAVVNFPDFLNNLSGCASVALIELFASRSHFIGSLFDEIQRFLSLRNLDLSHNQLNGSISEKLWELPRLGMVDISFNKLTGAISQNIGKSKLHAIYLSNNSLEGVPSTNHMSNLSFVESIDMRSCKLGPRFPKWIQKLKKLTRLDIADTRISDTVPLEFWGMWPSQLQYLNLSSNNISGKVSDLSSNFDNGSVIDLSSNGFYGPIPNVSSTLVILNLSRNKFYGGIFFLCQIADGFLESIDLSHNFLSGQLPDCLWHFRELKVLNLGNNNLSGRLPPSVESLSKLKVLYLYKNEFSGELPSSLKNCTSLNSLNLGANKFSGNVPVWIGESLSELYVLILRSNNFFGTIPLPLCQLPNLQVLDLSMNNLRGTIPSCLNNLSSMAHEGSFPAQSVHFFSIERQFSANIYYGDIHDEYADHALVEWLGDEREFMRSNLGLLKSIDLSSNNLTGQIPYELTNLHGLLALNLSKNALLGEIPQQIGEMKSLLALDLSENNLSEGIPSSMSQMTLLGYLDVSSNNLTGRIPTSTQLQSFDPSRYDGNARLCGPPLTKRCPGDEDSKVPPVAGESEIDEDERWFYIGGCTGFATGFWIACGTLLLNRHGRHAFFQLYDSFRDWVYVKVLVFIANLKRVEHT